MQEPNFGPFWQGNGVDLICPACKRDYVFHTGVEVYERPEDGAHGLHVAVTGTTAKVNTRLDGNPSDRRDGIRIHFSCEGCEEAFDLTIAQHKGKTFIAVESISEK